MTFGAAAAALAPPSVHPNGGAYTWALGYAPRECQIAALPDALARLLSEPERKRAEPLPDSEPAGIAASVARYAPGEPLSVPNRPMAGHTGPQKGQETRLGASQRSRWATGACPR